MASPVRVLYENPTVTRKRGPWGHGFRCVLTRTPQVPPRQRGHKGPWDREGVPRPQDRSGGGSGRGGGPVEGTALPLSVPAEGGASGSRAHRGAEPWAHRGGAVTCVPAERPAANPTGPRVPAGVEVAQGEGHVAAHGDDDGPLAAQRPDEERREEHGRQEHGAVEGAERRHPQALLTVQAALWGPRQPWSAARGRGESSCFPQTRA